MVQWKTTLNERKRIFLKYTHFPLNHDYGRKGNSMVLLQKSWLSKSNLSNPLEKSWVSKFDLLKNVRPSIDFSIGDVAVSYHPISFFSGKSWCIQRTKRQVWGTTKEPAWTDGPMDVFKNLAWYIRVSMIVIDSYILAICICIMYYIYCI